LSAIAQFLVNGQA